MEISLTEDFLWLAIKDNGKGISPHLLPSLGREKISFGKSNGNGLGLYNARKSIENWGGKLVLESEANLGTSATLILPRLAPPSWFVPYLELSKQQTICIVDDDPIVHAMWKSRFEEFEEQTAQLRVMSFSRAIDAESWIKDNDKRPTVLLVDEDLSEGESGFHFLSRIQKQNRAYLVTNHHDRKEVIERCAYRGLGLIAKRNVPFLPIRLAN